LFTPFFITMTEQTPETNAAQQKRFSINLLPIENKSDRLSYITNLSLFAGGFKNADEVFRLGVLNYSSDQARLDTTPLSFFVKQWKAAWYTEGWPMWRLIADSGCLLFQAKEIAIEWSIIIITSTDKIQYVGEIEDYLANWLLKLKKADGWEIAAIRAKTTQQSKYLLNWSLLNIKSKQMLTIWADDYCITDKSKNQICILFENKIATYTYDDDSIDRQSDYFDLSVYWNIKNIRTDTNNNFYFIISEKEWVSELRVLNRKTLAEVMSFKDITEIVYLSDVKGQLFCMDKDGYLRLITLSTGDLPRWYVDSNEITAETTKSNIVKIEDKPRSDLKNILTSGGLALSASTEESLEEAGESGNDDSQLREQIWLSKIDGTDGKTLRDLYDAATTPKDIDMVYSIVQQLKKNPHVMGVKWLIDPIVANIVVKRDKIKLVDIGERLTVLNTELPTINDFPSMMEFRSELMRIKQIRSQILAVDKDADAILKDTLTLIDEKIAEYQNDHKEQIVEDVKNNLKLISDYMEGIDYLPQITSVYGTDLWKQTEQILWHLNDEDRKMYKKQMTDLVSARQNHLSRQAKTVENAWQQRQEEQINEVRNSLTSLKGILDSINDEEVLKNMEMSDHLVLAVKETIEQLPANKAQELSQKLEQIFKERLLTIQFSKDAMWWSLKSLDQYGLPKSLYYVPDLVKHVKWDVSAKPTKDGKFKIQFISSAGNVLEPSINKKILWAFPFTYTFEEWKALKQTIAEWNSNGTKKKMQELIRQNSLPKEEQQVEDDKKSAELKSMEEKYYIPRMLDTMNKISGDGRMWTINTRNYLPHIDNRTVIWESIKNRLADWWSKLSQQQQYKQWILIVRSEAGTWKNFKCDILGHLMNREIFDVSCNQYMEKEDLLFSPEIDDNGTYRRPSKFVQWLQTPGAIVVLDEINTLKPWVAKLLNPLLDGRRYINDPQVGRIYAHPSVIFVWLMNPEYYRGTQPLNQEIISRARMTDDDYAPAAEEAFAISKYLDGSLWKLSEDEFKHYRNEYIDKQQTPNDKSIYNVFMALSKVVRVAAKIREVYSATMRGNAASEKELNYVFTQRDGNYVIQDFNYTKDIKKSIEDVVLKKIPTPEERDYAKEIIDDICR